MMKRLAWVGFALFVFACSFEEKLDDAPQGPGPVSAGAIEDEDIGRRIAPRQVVSLAIERPGATFLKPHFAYADLQPGDVLELVDESGLVVDRIDESIAESWGLSGDGAGMTVRFRASQAAGRRGFLIDRLGVGSNTFASEDLIGSLSQASVCGPNDAKPAMCLSDAQHSLHDPDKASVARAIGRMLFPSGGAMGLCTGSLVSPEGHFLTNNHCIATNSGAKSLEVKFNYQEPTCAGGGNSNAAVIAVKGATLTKTSKPLDYSLLQLSQNVTAQFGWIPVAPLTELELSVGDPIYIVQHPGGVPKKVAAYDSQTQTICTVRQTNVSIGSYQAQANIGYTCDTEGGSSGSPVLSAQSHGLVALHHLGGCNNSGTYLRDIYPQIKEWVPDPNVVITTPPTEPPIETQTMEPFEHRFLRSH
jgi:V8-like Glu-specific endopeptidase